MAASISRGFPKASGPPPRARYQGDEGPARLSRGANESLSVKQLTGFALGAEPHLAVATAIATSHHRSAPLTAVSGACSAACEVLRKSRTEDGGEENPRRRSTFTLSAGPSFDGAQAQQAPQTAAEQPDCGGHGSVRHWSWWKLTEPLNVRRVTDARAPVAGLGNHQCNLVADGDVTEEGNPSILP